MSIDDSEGVFGKRRRNIMICGIIVILIFFVEPKLNTIKILEINFNLNGKEWYVWLGLTIWFIYTAIRAYTYYITHIEAKVRPEKSVTIYGSTDLLKYWEEKKKIALNQFKKNIDKSYTVQVAAPTGLVNKKKEAKINNLKYTDLNGVLRLIKKGRIPGKAKLWVTYKLQFSTLHQESQEHSLEINFEPDSAAKKIIRRNKLKYISNDGWWEHSFIFIFEIIVLTCLVVHWFSELGDYL